jgi:hypothetical protein
MQQGFFQVWENKPFTRPSYFFADYFHQFSVLIEATQSPSLLERYWLNLPRWEKSEQ